MLLDHRGAERENAAGGPNAASLRRALVGAVAVPFALLLLVGIAFGVQIARLSRAARLVDHTDVVLAAARDVEVILLEQQEAAVAYVVTKDRADREVALDAEPETRVRRLQEIVEDDASRTILADAPAQVHAWTAWLRGELDAGAQDASFIRASESALRPARATLAAFVAAEGALRVRRNEMSQHEVRWTLLGGAGLLAVVGVLLGFVVRTQLLALQTRYESALEEQRESQKMSELLVGVLGHDLRSPLSAILLTSWTLAKSATGAEARMLEHQTHAAKRMERMISQLLDMTRARVGGGIVVKPKLASVGTVCREIVDEMASAHPGRSFELSVEGDVEAPIDPDRLGQVVANLLGNAATHGAEATAVSARVRRVGDEVEISVHNFGPPIPPELATHVFDAFRRADRARRSDGLGLGLYIADRIVAAHGGRIELESTAEAGTTFRIRIPAKR
jgi:signal transduction histidine kinase